MGTQLPFRDLHPKVQTSCKSSFFMPSNVSEQFDERGPTLKGPVRVVCSSVSARNRMGSRGREWAPPTHPFLFPSGFLSYLICGHTFSSGDHQLLPGALLLLESCLAWQDCAAPENRCLCLTSVCSHTGGDFHFISVCFSLLW